MVIGYKKDVSIRITSQEEIDKRIFEGHKGLVLVVEHKNQPSQHYHGYIKGIAHETLKKRIQKRYPGGNKVQKCTPVKDPERQLRYLFKGASEKEQPLIIFNDIVEDVEKENKQYWLEVNAVKEIKKKTKKSGIGFKEELLKLCKETYPGVTYISLERIVRLALDLSKESACLPPNDYNMQSYIEYVQLHFSFESSNRCIDAKIERMKQKFEIRSKFGF